MDKTTPQPQDWLGSHTPYEAGLADAKDIPKNITIHKLSANESARGASPLARQAFIEAASHLHRYPDFYITDLRQKIATLHRIAEDDIVFGNGSDELITLLIHAFGGAGKSIVMGRYGFVYYEVAAAAAGMNIHKAKESLTDGVDIDDIKKIYDDTTRLVFIANPNNPTGALLSQDAIHHLIESTPPHILIVLDAAYAEYVTDNNYEAGIELVRRHKNVVMLRTFSKIYGLSGLRIGWCFAPKAIAHVLNRLRSPFNINSAAQSAAKAALQDQTYIKNIRAETAKARNNFTEKAKTMGIKVFPSHGNFLLLQFPKSARHSSVNADQFLRRKGILLRRLEPYGLSDCLRITMGHENSLKLTLDALHEFMGK